MDAYQNLSREELLGLLRQRDDQIAALQRAVAALTGEVAVLKGALEEAHRDGKRQAAPFSKGPPKKDPLRSGRKSGADHGRHGHRQPPAQDGSVALTETHVAELPQVCPFCGGALETTGEVLQHQQELLRQAIHRIFRIQKGRCTCCGRAVRGRHALQTSDAVGAAGSQIGPDAQAMVVHLNKVGGLAHGKIAAVLTTLGVPLTAGASAQIVLRAAQRCTPAYEQIKQGVAESSRVTPDETGWKIAGELGWLHVFVTPEVTCFHVDAKRGFEAARQILPEDYEGTLIRDGWKPYERYELAAHQQCTAHLLRRCRRLIQLAQARGCPSAVKFPQVVQDLLLAGLALRDERQNGAIRAELFVRRREQLETLLTDHLEHYKKNPDNERLANFLRPRADQVFLYLWDNELDATNYRAETALRGPIANRKVFGGNRTANGANAQSVLCSVIATARQAGLDALTYLSQTLRRLTLPALYPRPG